VRKFHIKEELPDALDFAKMVKEVLDLHEDNISAKGFSYDQARQSALSELVDRNQEPGLEPMKEKGLMHAPPVIPAAGRSTGTEIDGLTEAFKAMVLALSTGNAGGFNPAAGLNQPRDSKGEARKGIDQSASRTLPGYSGQSQTLPQATRSCYYCWEGEHRRSDCPELKEDSEKGLCHLSIDGRICFGRPGPAARPAFMYRDRSQRSQVLSNARANGLIPPTASAKVSSIGVAYGDSDSEDDEVDNQEYLEAEFGIAAGEVRLKQEDKWRTPKAILKKKADTEKKLPRPRVQQAGKWEAVGTAEPMEIDESWKKEVIEEKIGEVVREAVFRYPTGGTP
jgi:hypothetical protein